MLRISAILASVAIVSGTTSGIPTYLQIGFDKFRSDANTLFVPQSELLSALVATGHVGKNIHTHQMNLHKLALRGPTARIQRAKGQVIAPLSQVFQTIEEAHKSVLAQVQNPMPTKRIANSLGESLNDIVVLQTLCERVAGHPSPSVSSFFRELSAVLQRATGLKTYLASLGPLVSPAELSDFETPKADAMEKIDIYVLNILAGYTALIELGASETQLASSFSFEDCARAVINGVGVDFGTICST
jgi:hypothetical protein